MLFRVHLNIFDTQCRQCPTESASGQTSNDQISKNRFQIRNLHTLKYWEQPCQVPVFDFIMLKKLIESVPAINDGDPPDFPRRGSWKRTPEESASHHTLKYWRPCCRVRVFNFIMSKNLIEGVPATNPGDPPDFPRRGSWKRKPEESASHHRAGLP